MKHARGVRFHETFDLIQFRGTYPPWQRQIWNGNLMTFHHKEESKAIFHLSIFLNLAALT